MKFAQPEQIQFLWFIIIFGVFLFWRRYQAKKLRERFAQAELLPEITKCLSSKREVTKLVLMILALVFSLVALMRPQWGFEWREIKKEGLDIIVAVDTSKSMLTQDVKPNRLARAKLGIRDLVKKLEGDRVGLIAFAGEGFLVCPLTVDYHGFLLTLDGIDTETIPRGGTALASAIKEGIRSLKDTAGKYKTMVIITDGEDLEGNVLRLAQKAKEEDIKVYTIGVGTKEGELIETPNRAGSDKFLKDKNGNFVKSRLNEKVLKEISLTTGGAYIKSTGVRFGLDVVYDQYLSKMEKREIKTQMEKRFYDRFQIPLALAFVLLCCETLLPLGKK